MGCLKLEEYHDQKPLKVVYSKAKIQSLGRGKDEVGLIVVGLNHLGNHVMSGRVSEPENGYDEQGNKINDNGGDETDIIYDKNGKELASTKVKHTYSGEGNLELTAEKYGLRLHSRFSDGPLYDPSLDVFATLYGGGLAKGSLSLGLKYFNTATGGLKQWIRTGASYSIKGGFKTFSTRWGAGGNHWQKIGNTTLQNFNKFIREFKLPGNNWRVQDPGHFHWKKLK